MPWHLPSLLAELFDRGYKTTAMTEDGPVAIVSPDAHRVMVVIPMGDGDDIPDALMRKYLRKLDLDIDELAHSVHSRSLLNK